MLFRSVDFLPGGFSLLILPRSEWRFVDSLRLILPDVFLKGHPVLLNIDLKLKFVVIRKVIFELMPSLIILLELSDQLIDVDLVLPKLIILIVFPLDHHQ